MYSAIARNKRNTVFIILLFLLIIGALGLLAGWVYDDLSIAIVVLVVATIYAVIQYFAASRLAVSMAGGQEIRKSDNPRVYRIVENLAITTGLPTPKIYIVERSGTERLRHRPGPEDRERRGHDGPAGHHGRPGA